MIEPDEGKTRIVIEAVKPEIDGGQFPIKRIIGDKVEVEADIFADGHEVLSAVLLYRRESDTNWTEVPMELLVNDRWRGSFVVTKVGRYQYTFTAWVDRFKTWRHNLAKKAEAPSTKRRTLTVCPVCNTEFYVVGSSDELPPVVNVTCPNCHTELVVDFKKPGKRLSN